MPIYTFSRDGETFEAVMSIAERDVFVCEPGVRQIIRPVQVMRDIPEYRSPVNGKLISSRSERRDDLARTNSREWDPSDSPTGGKLRNERFATKHGLKVSEEFRDLPMNQQFREEQRTKSA